MLTLQEIDNAFTSLGMALPSAELVSELEYLPDATADQVITTYAQSLGVGVIDRMFYVALGHFSSAYDAKCDSFVKLGSARRQSPYPCTWLRVRRRNIASADNGRAAGCRVRILRSIFRY